eukprot:750744-Hanusia_phi.AAC.1
MAGRRGEHKFVERGAEKMGGERGRGWKERIMSYQAIRIRLPQERRRRKMTILIRLFLLLLRSWIVADELLAPSGLTGVRRSGM